MIIGFEPLSEAVESEFTPGAKIHLGMHCFILACIAGLALVSIGGFALLEFIDVKFYPWFAIQGNKGRRMKSLSWWAGALLVAILAWIWGSTGGFRA